MKAVFCSEGIYSAALIANLGVYSAASSAVYTIMDILPSLVVSAVPITSDPALSSDNILCVGRASHLRSSSYASASMRLFWATQEAWK